MNFLRLQISGFKSFVDPTELSIEKGTTGIVGPNGCGKSNIVEGLKWIMGETSAKKMRGEEMDDVIFSGTENRPSRNLAEVQLLIDNSDRKAPSQFNDSDDLIVARRIERDMGSRFIINGRDVRARDVQLLFADANAGSQSTSLVGQGHIGTIINSKPQQRRGILEEAAGIKGLHSRRHEAELRLRAAETNLERVDDVLQTLDLQLRGLKKQARQANRYRNISGHIRKAEAMQLHLRWLQSALDLEKAEGELGEIDKKVVMKTTAAAETTNSQEVVAQGLPSLRETEAKAAAALHRLALEKDKISEEEERAKTDLKRLQERLFQINTDIDREEEQTSEAETTIQTLIKEKNQITEVNDQEAPKQKGIAGKLAKLNSQLKSAEGHLQDATYNAASANARKSLSEAESLTAQLQTEIKTLTEYLKIREDDLWPPLIDSISVEPGYEKALGAALGDDLNVATDDGAPVFWYTLPPLEDSPPLPKEARPLSLFVKGPDALNRRLSQIGLVESPNGKNLVKQLKQGQRLVNKDGAMWRWDGYTTTEEVAISAAERLDQRNKLKKLQSDLLIAEKTQLDALKLNELNSPENMQVKLDNLRNSVEQIRQSVRATETEETQLHHDSVLRTGRISIIAKELGAWEKRLNSSQKHTAELRDRKYEVNRDIEKLRSLPEQFKQRRDDLFTKLEHAEVQRRESNDTLVIAEQELAKVEKLSKNAQKDLSDSREQRVRKQSAVELAAQQLREVASNIHEKLNCEPQEALPKSEHPEGKELPEKNTVEIRLNRLRLERDRMGPVNLRAEIESESMKEQIDTLSNEREDLVAAIARLRQGISSLNREGRQRMLTSFEKVNEHFRSLFTELFSGGRAHLKLIDSDDPLAAGLEIMASPPGKRLQVMSLLSGGEQALTALALLFAVFKTNPAPICVLDEVDAPLDDSNVNRFCNLVDTMATNLETRFLIITHNTITMSRMNRLYGVTMEENGVSQLVSVDLEQAEDIREAV